MGTTALFGLRYPEDVDSPNGPLEIQNLAEDVEAILDVVCPIGTVLESGRATAPARFLIADGGAHSRSTYARLFAAIGTAFGAGDGSTTFNVPDKRGRVGVGKGTHAEVDTVGDNDGDATVANRRSTHKHSYTDPVEGLATVQTYLGTGIQAAANGHQHHGITDDGGPHFLTLLPIIRAT